MAIYFNQKQANSIMKQQFAATNAHRSHPDHQFPAYFMNAGLKPQDLYQEFDEQVTRVFRLDDGEAILQRLMPLATSVSLGRTVLANARSSEMGGFQTTMHGEDVLYDNVTYDTDKALIPLHQNGFKRNFREGKQFGLEGFQDLVIMQEEGARTHRIGLIDYMLDGTSLTIDGVSWGGFRGDSRVDQVDLSTGTYAFDFTDKTQTGEDVVTAFTALAERRFVDNKVNAPCTWFVSNEVYWNFTRDYSDAKGDNTIKQRVLGIPTVAEVVPSSKLSGNEILSMPLNAEYVRPVVGQAVSTVAMPQTKGYRSPMAFEIYSAVGIQVKTDFNSQGKAVQYAAG